MQKHEAEKQFEKYIRENELLIYKVCRVYAYTEDERQDLFQEIVIQLWKAFPKFREQSKFSTWLYRVATNTAITGLRKQKHPFVPYEATAFSHHSDHASSTEVEEEQVSLLYKAIDHLNQVEKAIVMLYMEEKTYDEMEEILGMSQGNLRVKMNRIKEKLRQLAKTL